MSAVETLNGLIGQLDSLVQQRGQEGDAIDRVLAAAPRQTAVRSLGDDEVMARFRQELADGLIRVDTVGKVLGLVSQIVGAYLAGRA